MKLPSKISTLSAEQRTTPPLRCPGRDDSSSRQAGGRYPIRAVIGRSNLTLPRSRPTLRSF